MYSGNLALTDARSCGINFAASLCRKDFLARVHLPDSDSVLALIRHGRRDPFAVGGEGDRHDVASLGHSERPDALAGTQVPDFEAIVPRPIAIIFRALDAGKITIEDLNDA